MFKVCLIIFSLYTLALTHSTFYPIAERNETCWQPNPAQIYSWHIHLIFFQLNPGNQQGAIEIRERFMMEFKDVLSEKECPTFDHQNFNCLFEIDWEPTGPFPTANWAVYFLPDQFYNMVSWMTQNRGDYDIFIHPNTGCSLEDHTNWAIIGGNSWPLNIGAFPSDAPFNEPPYIHDKDSLIKHQKEALENKKYLKGFLEKENII